MTADDPIARLTPSAPWNLEDAHVLADCYEERGQPRVASFWRLDDEERLHELIDYLNVMPYRHAHSATRLDLLFDLCLEIGSLTELLRHTARGLLSCQHVGRKTVSDLEHGLAVVGLALPLQSGFVDGKCCGRILYPSKRTGAPRRPGAEKGLSWLGTCRKCGHAKGWEIRYLVPGFPSPVAYHAMIGAP